MTPMYALTFHQPYASLVALRVKGLETRGWAPPPRQADHIASAGLWVHAGVGSHLARSWRGLGRELIAAHDHGGDYWAAWCRLADEVVLRRNGLLVSHTPGALHRVLEGRLPLGQVIARCRVPEVLPILDGRGSTDPHVLVQPDRLWLVGPTEPQETAAPWAQEYLAEAAAVNAERPLGDFTPGRFAWVLTDVEAHEPPAPAKGLQRLWRWQP